MSAVGESSQARCGIHRGTKDVTAAPNHRASAEAGTYQREAGSATGRLAETSEIGKSRVGIRRCHHDGIADGFDESIARAQDFRRDGAELICQFRSAVIPMDLG
ncbi:hypothetical protein [Mycolicibacterium iranicum]|uniref:hypothetical protein n=1 Tax=Mycolicibacterium iranicum TaxID=912594 RepID=UPI001F320A49|nr:hypothetical protein [Mycolicibacterium iranicum]